MSRKLVTIVLITVLGLSLGLSVPAQDKQEAASPLTKEKYIPDIATFMQIGANSPAGYSWDGKDVFFESRMSGAYQVYRLTEEGWPYQLTLFEDGIDFFTLSHDGKSAIVGASVGGSEQSQLYLMCSKTGQLTTLTEPKSDTLVFQYGSVTWAKDDA